MGWVLGILGVIVLVLGGALVFTEGERREGKNLPIAAVDFRAIPDGTYRGKYEGGMYGWRKNEVEVKVSGGRVTDIELVGNPPAAVTKVSDPLFERVVQAQSLQVDTISMATITSKSYLKSVEKALSGATGH